MIYQTALPFSTTNADSQYIKQKLEVSRKYVRKWLEKVPAHILVYLPPIAWAKRRLCGFLCFDA
jgi:hypothetical protein